MSRQQNMQESRYELKYIVTEAKARQMREFITQYLAEDINNPEEPHVGYPVHSLYLDNSQYTLMGATEDGLKNRYKLRLRFYEDDDTKPVFFEVKSRVNDIIRKSRASVKRSSVNRLLFGHQPSMDDVFSGKDKDFVALQKFCNLQRSINATGSAFVSYKREAFVNPLDDSSRVTIDRDLIARDYRVGHGVRLNRGEVTADMKGAVLELKFTDRFPGWMRSLVHTFNLQRTSMPKYVTCVDALEVYYGGRGISS